MRLAMNGFLRAALMLGLAVVAANGSVQTVRAAPGADLGFLAVAADRGFQGDEELRDAFDAFAAGRNAELVFATDARTRGMLAAALARLAQRGARRAVVLPMFLSANDPALMLVKEHLANASLPVSFARTFGESYLAVEALADRLRTIRRPNGARLVVVGYGARDDETRRLLERDWQRLAEQAAAGFGFARVHALVWYDSRAPEREARRAEIGRALADATQEPGRTVVVPFHLGWRADGMMSFDAELKPVVPAGVDLAAPGPGPEAMLATWMAREANYRADIAPRELGVILLAHGADYHWNETMRQAAQPLEARYLVEYVFSMADQPLIERAVRRLERRGARAVVIVRVFGLASSFKDEVERMIGADVEAGVPSLPRGDDGHSDGQEHGQGNGHSHGSAPSSPPARIRSSLPVVTVGGVEASPLFAAALLDRARALSRDPRTETVILTAHGAGDDSRNEHWLKILDTLAAHMKAGGAAFRAIRYATWREDWPEKRGPWVARVREMVDEATRDGGRAIVIPARTSGRGPERAFLDGLKFDLGEGFAPHPLFAQWVEEQIRTGVALLGSRP
ncbi:MAG: cobalamin biosynthesis protein CbiX [Pseudomonadota bacterium]